MEVTPKTLADVKGGTLISYEGKVQVDFFSCLDEAIWLQNYWKVTNQTWCLVPTEHCLRILQYISLLLRMPPSSDRCIQAHSEKIYMEIYVIVFFGTYDPDAFSLFFCY